MITNSKEKIKAELLYKKLFEFVSAGKSISDWWNDSFDKVYYNNEMPIILAFISLIAKDKINFALIVDSLAIERSANVRKFENILDFLLNLHKELVNIERWQEALIIEIKLYSLFIKQYENIDFYQNVFNKLYEPYHFNTKSLTGVNYEQIEINVIQKPKKSQKTSKILFWFQNFHILAHTTLVLDLINNCQTTNDIFISALYNEGYDKSRHIFEQSKSQVIFLKNDLDLKSKCDELIEICQSKNIENIVFVSVPLQSGYFKRVSKNIVLTWWSMKFPLSGLKQFDRFVCNRTLEPKREYINNTEWFCAPFALRTIQENEIDYYKNIENRKLKIGVLSREEKFSSSQLPEIINRTLINVPNSNFFWTGRRLNQDIEKRILKYHQHDLRNRVKFCGWVDPAAFLNDIDLLIDTPNLGGIVSYWMMSLGKVVISSTEHGSVGSLGKIFEVEKHFTLLENKKQILNYFNGIDTKPYFLSHIDLIPTCIEMYSHNLSLLENHGKKFLNFFKNELSNIENFSKITLKMINGEYEL